MVEVYWLYLPNPELVAFHGKVVVGLQRHFGVTNVQIIPNQGFVFTPKVNFHVDTAR